MALVSLFFLITVDKATIHLAINDHHNAFFDSLFKYITYIGDGLFTGIAGIIVSIFLFRKTGLTPFWFGASVLISSGLLAQLLKRLVYEGALRPTAFLREHSLHLVEGVQVHAHHSFPSGHTTSAFAFFGFAALFLARKSPILQVVFAFIAGLVGYSRMYLSQHFLEDVFAGLLLGSFCSILFIFLFQKRLAHQE